MYSSTDILIVIVSTIFAILWTRAAYTRLVSASKHQPILEKPAEPLPTQPATPNTKSAPKRKGKGKRARVVSKKHYSAPAPAQIIEVQHSSDDDVGYYSNPTSAASCSSQSSVSDEESAVFSPVVINGTTYYSNSLPMLSECQIHGFISTHLKASMKQLKENGYPYFRSMMSKTAMINSTQYTAGKKMLIEKEDRLRVCCGCQKEFELETNAVCQFHPKGKRFDKARGGFIRNCCEEDDGASRGCKTRDIHVFDQLYSSEMDQFLQTEKPTGSHDPRSTKVYALDAEMVYTMAGPALARLSVIDWFGNSVLDVMVKPPTRVLDANTEYSGLTIKDVNAAKETLGTCRRKLLQLVNSDTILVGHSLESDLKALRLVHYNIADTSLIYKTGKNKIGLKTLALDYLGLAIQSNNKDQLGHDSEEDARVCLELLKLRIESSV